jgi:hypothetical protein
VIDAESPSPGIPGVSGLGDVFQSFFFPPVDPVGGWIVDGWKDFEGIMAEVSAGKITSGDLFGTRRYLKNNYLVRMAAALLGIYGNSKEGRCIPPTASTRWANRSMARAIPCISRRTKSRL